MAPSPTPHVSVVVAWRDEGATLSELVHRVEEAASTAGLRLELILVDDHSEPRQAAQLAALAESGHTRPMTLVEGRGQVAALVCGMEVARGEVVVTMDGDLQDAPEDIGRIFGPALATGLAVGQRDVVSDQWWRRTGSRLASRLAGVLTGIPLPDYGGQFNGYRADVAARIVAAWRPGAALLPLAASLHGSAVSVPVRRTARQSGRTRYRAWDLASILLDLVAHQSTARHRWGAILAGSGAMLVGAGGLSLAPPAHRCRRFGAMSLTAGACVLAGSAVVGARRSGAAHAARPRARDLAPSAPSGPRQVNPSVT